MVTKVKANRIMAINGIATTIEQSKKLIELGLNADTADMYYYNNDEIPQIISDIKLLKENINPKFYTPAWSFSALLSLLPLFVSKEKGYPYFLEWQFWNDNSLRYVNPYSDERKCLVDIYSDHDEERKDFFDILFEMVCYLLENKLIK